MSEQEENDINTDEMFSSSDESCTSDDFALDNMTEDSLVSQELQIARPPEVLERSLLIQKEYSKPAWNGFRLCGDNLDKNVRRRHMRSDRQTESLHYFYSYGVLNRIDFSALSDVRIDNSCLDVRSVAKSLLPTPHDDQSLKANISILISRILCTHLPYFGMTFDGLVDWHIKHRYYNEMSSKSEVVSFIHTSFT